MVPPTSKQEVSGAPHHNFMHKIEEISVFWLPTLSLSSLTHHFVDRHCLDSFEDSMPSSEPLLLCVGHESNVLLCMDIDGTVGKVRRLQEIAKTEATTRGTDLGGPPPPTRHYLTYCAVSASTLLLLSCSITSLVNHYIPPSGNALP